MILAAPITRKMLVDWAGERKFQEGKALYERGLVQGVEYEEPVVSGTILRGARSVKSSFRVLRDGSAESLCPCYDNRERGIICTHVIAIGLALIDRLTDPDRERKRREEIRRANRLQAIDESEYAARARRGTPGTRDASLELHLPADWDRQVRRGGVRVACRARIGTERVALPDLPDGWVLGLDEADESLLFVLEDIQGGPLSESIDLSLTDLMNALGLCRGRRIRVAGREEPAVVNAAPMESALHVDLDRGNGELLLRVVTALPFEDEREFPVYIVAGKQGWVYHAGHFWPLDNVLPGPLQSIYYEPAAIGRPAVPRFFRAELARLKESMRVVTDLSPDLFTIEPAEPRFRVQLRGSPASLAPTVYAEYDGIRLVAGKPDPAGHFALPDPADFLRYTVRHDRAEMEALAWLGRFGIEGDRGDEMTPVVGCREVLNFLGRAVPMMRRRGWRVEFAGRIAPEAEAMQCMTPVVRVESGAGPAWFEVEYRFEDQTGASISHAEIRRALHKGDSYIECGGRIVLLDTEAVESLSDLFSECSGSVGEGHNRFRVPSIYSAYVQLSLDALDGVDVEAQSEWIARVARQNRRTPPTECALPAGIEPIMREYQKEGVRWLRFLEASGFCGILADEMGLGKTLQALAWLAMERLCEDARGRPALVVCPTSLVENWAEEAARFVPEMRTLMLTGSTRHERWEEIEGRDLVITSYALLRRDIERYLNTEFSALILDEAQHIKNHSTRNAVAAKQVRAANRLVLTGTPMENSVADVWSIMDFLMPSYLGGRREFRRRFELPIARNDELGQKAQATLRRKVQPFLMRRLKSDVAKDLPPKIARTATCGLTADQQAVYRELLDDARRRLTDLVAEQGFDRSRMEVLRTLLRLRQACCHLDLLKMDGMRAEKPSAKMDLFFELLDEALDSGHRMLVFSQFVSMLSILRRELEARDLSYCYLDGATKNRMDVVREFNTRREIPLFLISLKAGGTGLNLTGADTVIHFDPWWNPAVEDQATDRAYRIGQKKTVYSIKLITRGTVEEKVVDMQRRKQALIDATVAKSEPALSRMGWEEIREILAD
jgi:superfamily II DNA or RNA helicase